MFQGVWNTAKGGPHTAVDAQLPEGFIPMDAIEHVRLIYWDEHCLECAAPACYGTCPIYEARRDGACRRLAYGIRLLRAPKRLLWHAVLRFRRWGKIEARINRGTLPPHALRRYDASEKRKAAIFKMASRILAPSTYAYSRKWDGLRRKTYAEYPAATPLVSDFLFQCHYSGERPAFRLFFEITDCDNTIVYKDSIDVRAGYTQQLLRLDFPLPEGGLVRLYPEDNYEAELEIFCADFVRLKKDVPASPAKTVKCVAWDLDNTVWQGVLIESDPLTLALRESVMDAVLELDRRGIIQIVVSKNDREAVLPVLERLGLADYMVCVYANWAPKSQNIYYASKLLNIGLDTFALIDDQPFERAEVSETLPCVRTYPETDLPALLHRPELAIPVTEESARRRDSYRQELLRREVRDVHNRANGGNADFIRSCGLTIRVETPHTSQQKQRCVELLLRTNQLNLSAHRYTESEFDALLSSGTGVPLILYAHDRFGDYGQVAFLYLTVEDAVEITEYVMSCRVAGKLVENALFAWLRTTYGDRNIRAVGAKTDRNTTLVDAFIRTGFAVSTNDGRLTMQLDRHTPIGDADAVILEDRRRN